ncbi:Superfamily II helicase-like protein [Deinococcus gobiensis I-0]|uniref:Superfamily II helicase-like protein n=2 Tax=Deinococcus TaxID=1298 RepID=H8GXN4_DEIGI|nr:Superfamily II helicase-like protein [Deinococcus gobiensis I-0]
MPYPTFEEHPDTFNATQVPAGQDAYFGVAFRKDNTSGKADNCQVTNLVWVDVDLVDHPEFSDGLSKAGLLEATPEDLKAMKAQLLAWILQVCAAHDLHVRAAVDSGHGIQAFFARRYGTDHADTERFNKALALLLGGDPKSTDVARILRLPGTLNLKNPKRPLLVEVVHQNPEAWVEDAALGALPLPEKPAPVALPTPSPRPALPAGSTKLEVWAQKALADECEILQNSVEGGRNHQLNISAVKLGSIIAAGALDEAQVRQELTAAAQAAGLEPDEIPDTLHSGLTHGKKSPRDLSHVGQEQAAAHGVIGKGRRAAVAGDDDNLTPQPPSSGVYVEHSCYYIDRPRMNKGRIVDWTPERLTNFVWEPALKLNHSGGMSGERGTLVIRGAERYEIQLESRVWNSRKDLLEAIGGYRALCITTNNADVAKIADYIAATYPDLPVAQGVQSYGLHKHQGQWVEVYEDLTVSTFETPPLFYSGTPVDPGSKAFKAPRLGTDEQVEAARRAIVKLPGLITPAVAYAQLGYAAASVFSPRITPYLGNRLPFVYVAGERESGKTSGAQIVLELTTGYSARLTKASGMTAYQYDIAHSSANNMLALLDEYRPGEIDDAQLRKHHDLGTKWRGTGKAAKDLAYELNAPMIVLGEGFTDDAATKSRGVLYFTRKADRGGLDGYSELLKLPLWAYAGHLHQLARDLTDEDHAARMTAAGDLAGQAIGDVANPRLRYALTYIAYGLLVLQADTEAIPDEAILSTLREGVHNMLEGGEEGVTNLELFLEQLCFALAKVPNPQDYVIPSVNGTLILRPRMCVDLVKERYREQAAIANAKLFDKYAKESSFFDQGDKHRAHDSTLWRGQRLRVADVPERCDVGLLESLEKSMRPAVGGLGPM